MKVLFLGNSHTYFNDMPYTFARLCEAAAGEKPELGMLAFSGRSLEWHMQEYFSLRFNLLHGGYDFCIIQEHGHPFPGREVLLRDGGQVAELCRAVGVQPVALTTWAARSQPEVQPEISRAYRDFAAQSHALLAPVGEIWADIRRTHPEIELFWQDGSHASPLGDYLIAVTLCSLLTGCNPVGLPARGGDFLQGAALDFKNARAVENPAQIETALDPAACSAIQQAVRCRLSAGEAQ